MQLRCDHKLHGHIDGNVLEVGCQSRFCGKRPGIVVVHRFDVTTGKLIETKRFKDPVKQAPEMGTEQDQRREALEKEGANGSRNRVSIRHP